MKKIVCALIAFSIFLSSTTVAFAAPKYPVDPPYKFFNIAGEAYHGYSVGVVQVDSTVIYGSEMSQVPYSVLSDMCSHLNSVQSYYVFRLVCVAVHESSRRYMVSATHSISGESGFGGSYEGRLGGYSSGDTIIFYAFESSPASTTPITSPDPDITVPSTPSLSFDDTDVINAIEGVFDQLTWVVRCQIEQMQDTLLNGRILLNINNLISKNVIPYLEDILIANSSTSGILQLFYDRFNSFLSSFESKFSDLTLSYYNDNEIVLNVGGRLDWSESDRGAINLVANDIGTLELVGFPDVSGYIVDHDVGDDLIVRRNDGTYFPNTWELSGGTVTMPAIVDGYSSITVIAPAGAVVTLAGNEHTMTDDAYSVNVEFGSYTINIAYGDGDAIKTTSYTVEVDGYNDYAVTFDYTPGGFVVSVLCTGASAATGNYYIYINGEKHTSREFYQNSSDFRLPVGSEIKFQNASSVSSSPVVYVDGVQFSNGLKIVTYTVTSDCSIVYQSGGRWDITTSDTSSIVGDFETPTVTITANPSTSTPVTIQRIVLPAGSSYWQAVDTDGNTYSFDPVSNLALNRSFVVHTYSSEEVAALSNFPSGSWSVSWTGESKYITVKFEEYSKFFLWLNRFLINFRDTLYTKMEDITVTASGDIVLNSKDYTAQLDSINATLSNLSFSGEVNTDLTPVITSIDAVGVNIEDLNASLNANFNTNIGSLLDKLDIVIEGSSESLENRINVAIDASNEAYNVFYVTGEDGETQSVTEFTGDLTSASGRLLSLLYRLVFADTLSGVDDDLDGFEDFFTSQGDDTGTQSMESPYEEENVWLAS